MRQKKQITLHCATCGDSFKVAYYRAKRGAKFCSKACRKKSYQEVKKSFRKGGYIRLTGGGLDISEHRYIMEQVLGRRLEPWEEVHHINGDKTDNRPSNLQIMQSKLELKAEHPIPRWAPYESLICGYCGKGFFRRKSDIKINVINHYCNRKCYDAYKKQPKKKLGGEHV